MSAEASQQKSSAAGRAEWLFVLVLLAVGIAGPTLGTTGWFTAVPGDLGDARFNSVILEHLYRWSIGGVRSLNDPGFFFPFPRVLAFSDNHFGSGIAYVLARLAGLNRELAFDAWYVFGAALNYVAALYALRRFGLPLAASGIGAFVFAFAMPVLAASNHVQLVYRFATPLAALALWEAISRRRVIDFARVVFWTTWQFYCALYLGIFLVYLLAALTIAFALATHALELRPWSLQWRQESAKSRAWFAIIVLASLGALAWLFWLYLGTSASYGFGRRPLDEIASLLPRWGSYFTMDGDSLAPFGRQSDLPNRHEHQLFIGYGAMLLVVLGVVAVVRTRSSVGIAMLAAFGALVAGTLIVGNHSLYFAVTFVPGLGSLRAVTRIIVVMLLPLGLLAAFGASSLAVRAGALRWVVYAVAGLLVVLEPLVLHVAKTPIAVWEQRLAETAALLPPALPADAILYVRTPSEDSFERVITELDGMILAQDRGLSTLNGYSGYVPPGYAAPDPCLDPMARLAAYAAFSGEDVRPYESRVVIVDRGTCAK